MAGRKTMPLSRMPNHDCRACHGMGSVRMTAHFYTGDHEWETPCWMCFGNDVKVQLPYPPSSDN